MGLAPEEEIFHNLLNFLARSCRFDFDAIMLEIYDRHLSKYGYAKVNEALKEILVSRGTRDPFPSVRDIEKVINPEVDKKSMATLIANNIRKFIRQRGRYWKLDSDIIGIGMVAYEVIQGQGGWAALCDRANDTDAGVFFAQLERSVQAVLEENRAKTVKEKLELPIEIKQKIVGPQRI